MPEASRGISLTWARTLRRLLASRRIGTVGWRFELGIQIAAASLPLTAGLLGKATIPTELWALVFVVALLVWALSEAISRLAWRDQGHEAIS
jgi:hypothetical protein